MTYLVNYNCIKCKYTDCVEVCPVDCFYEHKDYLVINPDECIDCALCAPECPVDAIVQDYDLSDVEKNKLLNFNKTNLDQATKITEVKPSPANADDMAKIPGEEKFQELCRSTV